MRASVTLEGDSELDIAFAVGSDDDVRQSSRACPAGRRRIYTQYGSRANRRLGTEYGLEVSPDNTSTEIHVFEGQVELHRIVKSRPALSLTMQYVRKEERFAGSNPLRRNASPTMTALKSTAGLGSSTASTLVEGLPYAHNATHVLWLFIQCSDLNKQWERYVVKQEPKQGKLSGGIVGANWNTGRWPWKDASNSSARRSRATKNPGALRADFVGVLGKDRQPRSQVQRLNADRRLRSRRASLANLRRRDADVFSQSGGNGKRGANQRDLFFQTVLRQLAKRPMVSFGGDLRQWFRPSQTICQRRTFRKRTRPGPHPAREIVFWRLRIRQLGIPTPNHRHRSETSTATRWNSRSIKKSCHREEIASL